MLYLLLAGLEFWLGGRYRKLQSQQIVGGKPAAITSFLLTVAMLLVSFSECWALTRIFPFNLILILMGALALGNFLYFVTGAITGFTLPEKQQKMTALALIWGVSSPRRDASLCA